MNSEHHMARMSEPPVPTLTAEEQEAEALADSIAGCFSNVSDLPEWMRVQALGCYMRPLTLIAARAVIGSEWLRARDEARVSEAVERALREAADELRERWVKEGRHEGLPGCYSSGYERWLRGRAAAVAAGRENGAGE